MLHGIDPVFAVSGLAVGLLVGITGVGGGSLMTPLLVLVFGVHPATAVGTDLLYAGLTKITRVCCPRLSRLGRLAHHAASCLWERARGAVVTSVACASRDRLPGERRNHQHDSRNRLALDRRHPDFSQGAARAAWPSHGRRGRANDSACSPSCLARFSAFW